VANLDGEVVSLRGGAPLRMRIDLVPRRLRWV
jgi:hypothetical protein